MYEVIVFAAKRYGLSRVLVFRGVMGYEEGQEVMSEKFWEISGKMPLLIEIIDETSRIDAFTAKILPWLGKVSPGSLITEESTLVRYIEMQHP